MNKSLLKLKSSKIKLLLLSLIIAQFISLQVIAQNSSGKHWFIDKNAVSSTGTGKTIGNAWTSFAGIGWSSMADGDTLFISGGADSTFYYEQLNVGRGHITIMPATIVGHNGKVIIDGQGIRSYCIQNNTYSYVTIYGLDLRNGSAANIQLRNNNCVLSHNMLYIASGATSGLDIRGSNNIIEYTTSRTSNLQNDGQRDFCQATTGGHHIFRYNTHYNYNPDPDDHTDFIQCYPPFDDIEVYGNYVVDAEEKRANSNLIYLNGLGGVVKVYNNVVIDQSDSTVNTMITIKETTTATDLDTLLVYNNSLYSSGFGYGINIDASVVGTPVYMAIYNNAIRGDSKGRDTYTTNAFIPILVKSSTTPTINNNIYWEDDPARNLALSYNGSSYSFSSWQGLGFDVNGLNAIPSYTSITEGAFNLQSTVGGNLIDNGKALNPSYGIKFDQSINEIKRAGGIWDIGAYQYSTSNDTTVETHRGNVKVNLRVILQGPYNGTVMLTALSESELIPDSQPYNISPWNYTGDEKINSIPTTMVDWVLVELRNADDPAQVVSTRAGLLRSDGSIMEPDGTLGVTFKNILYGSYYIAIRHRNHLAVMSSSPVLFSPDNDLYDFTTSISKAYGQDGMMQDTSSGVFMMYSGDGNGNGIIDGDDYDGVWSEDNGNIGYLNGDFNLDSGVNSKDSREFWNNGKSTKAP